MSRGADWALITGAGAGIGAALALTLARRGICVALAGRQQARLAAVRDQIAEQVPVCVAPVDIGLAESRARLHETVSNTIAAQDGRLRYLVHNAGIGTPSPDFARTDPVELERAFAVNVTAPLALSQAFLPSLRRAAPSRILLVGAGIADRAQPGTGIYGVAKKALARLFDQMVTDFAHEAQSDLPAVALFQPGMVDTEGLRAHITMAADCGLPHAAWLDAALRKGEARRPAEVAEAMATALIDLPIQQYHGQTLRAANLLAAG